MFFMKSNKDLRMTKRIPVGFDLLYKVDGSPEISLGIGKKEICTHMFDLSEGGMSMWVNSPIAVRSEISITFHVIFKKGQTPPIDAKGVVVYCTPLPEAKKYRIGINFTDILPQDLLYITELVGIKSKAEK